MLQRYFREECNLFSKRQDQPKIGSINISNNRYTITFILSFLF